MNGYMTVWEVEKLLGNAANKSGRVVANAANRTLPTGAKVIKQETANEYNVRQKDVEETLRRIKANWSDPTAILRFTGGHGNLYNFGKGDVSVLNPRYTVRSSSPFDPDPGNVFARIMRNGSMDALDQNPKPFVQIVNGNLGLFQRISDDARAALRGVAPPAIPQVIRNDKVQARFQKETGEMFQKRVLHEIDRLMKGY